ncbi:SDR family NAD(P)-dependent oxidoreductase [Guyparkeria sp. 1SP6A2]|nr:SDR family NAD(P)-dependent oxidoreductase [Guyparkeria sp. 1SP6A2]
MSRDNHPIVLIGYGDIARRVAARLPDHAITAVARQHTDPPEGHRGDWQSLVIDLDRDIPLRDESFPADAIWVYLAPPPRTGQNDPRVARWLRFAPRPPAAMVYISTTGVYGDHAGEWVDESMPPNPGHQRGWRRLDAEDRLGKHATRSDVPLACLRVTGIYTCERLPLAKLRAGTPVPGGDQAPWSNRIHADDLTDIIVRLIERIETGQPVTGTFNVSDNQPMRISEVYRLVAEHFGLPHPKEAAMDDVLAQASPMAREFLSESRRVDASAIQQALDWQPRYPNIEATLAACGKSSIR